MLWEDLNLAKMCIEASGWHKGWRTAPNAPSPIYSSLISWLTTDHRLSSFERMNMILKDRHNMILIKERYPMEESIQESLRIFIKSFTNTVYRYMIIHKLDLLLTTLKSLFHEIFLNTIKRMQVTWIKNSVTDLTPLEIQKTSSVLYSWNSINNITIFIPLELLRKILEESRRFKSDISLRKLVQPSIMIAQSQSKWHNISNLIRNSFHLLQKEIPSIGTSRNIIIICHISSNYDYVQLVSYSQFSQTFRCSSASRITSVHHSNWNLWIRRQCFVYCVYVKLVVVFYLYPVFCVWLQIFQQNWMHLSWC